MKIKYKIYDNYDYKYKDYETDIEYATQSLYKGYTEQKTGKLIQLVELLIIDYVKRNPESIEKIADILELEGEDFEVTDV